MARLELKGIDNRVREDVKVLAKTHGVTVAKFLEPAIKNYIYQADNRERLIRAKRSDPDWEHGIFRQIQEQAKTDI